MKRPWLALLVVVLCAGLIAGCATANSIQSARKQLNKAKDAGAVWSAPYEYYAAEAYLAKAVHEAEEGVDHLRRDQAARRGVEDLLVAVGAGEVAA